MAGKEKVKFSGVVSPQEAAQYLESLAKGLRERTMLLESGDASLTIEVTDDVKIEIEGSGDAEKGKSSIELTLTMRRKPAEVPVSPGLLIVANGATERVTFAD
jgi:amphi-Trp domain-containing protein